MSSPGIARAVIALFMLACFCSSQNVQAQVLEEIVVTATKRSESLQSVPLSISAIQGDDLVERGITEFFEYAVTVPNLSLLDRIYLNYQANP